MQHLFLSVMRAKRRVRKSCEVEDDDVFVCLTFTYLVYNIVWCLSSNATRVSLHKLVFMHVVKLVEWVELSCHL